jgi:hypothetical protein
MIGQELDGYSINDLKQMTPEGVVDDVDSTIDPAFHGHKTYTAWTATKKSQQVQMAKDALDIIKLKKTPAKPALTAMDDSTAEEALWAKIKDGSWAPNPAKPVVDSWKKMKDGTWAPNSAIDLAKEGSWATPAKPKVAAGDMSEPAFFTDPEIQLTNEELQNIVKGEQNLQKAGKPQTTADWFTNVYGKEQWKKIQAALKAVK